MLFDKYTESVISMARSRRVSRALGTLSLAFAALVAGSRSIPLGDNGTLLRDLAARAGRSGPRGPKQPARRWVKDR